MQKAVYLVLLVFTSMCWAQDSSFLAVVRVDYSSTSGKEDTQFSLDKERHIFFIESDNKEELLFYNAFLKENEESHSAGTIKNVKRIKNTKAQQVYSFEWNFENSFDAITSAEKLPFGKPHPEVYINCAAELGLKGMECIAFEDSFNGMIAAKAARMKCVVVPAATAYDHPKWNAADLKLRSLLEFDEEKLKLL